MVATALETHSISTDEKRNISADMSTFLADGELLTGTPTIQCSDKLTITNAQINTAAVTINKVSVAAGKAVQFTVAGSISDSYIIEALANTDAGQVVEGKMKLDVSTSKH